MTNTERKSQAREVWSYVRRLRKPFTANTVAEKTGVDLGTVRHYFTWWKGKGSMVASGKVEEVGVVGRPRTLWEIADKKFISVWR